MLDILARCLDVNSDVGTQICPIILGIGSLHRTCPDLERVEM